MNAERSSASARIKSWKENPLKFADECLNLKLDKWQEDALKYLGGEPNPRRRVGMKACTGPGKSFALAVGGWHRLLCFGNKGEHPKGAALSGEGRDNLRDNLWAELSKLQQRSELLKTVFTWTGERIYANDHPETWFISARSYAKDATAEAIGTSLSGLHSNYPFLLLDETGRMPVTVGQKASQIFTGGVIDGLIMAAGNPTSQDGLLYHMATIERALWKLITITADPDDPKRTPRVDIAHAREQISLYGRDNPWVMATILGMFPPGGINTLLSVEEVEASMARHFREDEYDKAQYRLGVDVARFGDDRCFDDKTEILTNEGWMLFQDLKGHEKVLSIGADEDKAGWGDILHIHKYDFDGALNLHEKKHLNFAITDNHRMFIRSNPTSDRYIFKPYRDLANEFVVRESNGWNGSNESRKEFTTSRLMPNGGFRLYEHRFEYDDWAAFLGWFISEGNVYVEKRVAGRLRIIITQNPGDKRDLIESLLTKMGIKWRTCSNGMQIEFSNKTIGQYLIDHCGVGAKNKRIPDEIKNASESAMNAFLDAFLLGDGTCRKDGNGRVYITTSKRLADDIQEMLAKLGRAGMLVLKNKKGSEFYIGDRKVIRQNDSYSIYERRAFTGKYCKKADVTKMPYKGLVWCVATPKESIYVRRNGIPMWSGNTVIFPRQGIASFDPVIMRNARSNEIASRVMYEKDARGSDLEFVDGTGGWGSGVIDSLLQAQMNPHEINFSAKATDSKYYNLRAEMWFKMAEWVKRGALPKIPALIKELTTPTYSFRDGKFLLESKEQIKARLGFSPDLADGLALTFAIPELPKNVATHRNRKSKHAFDNDPYS